MASQRTVRFLARFVLAWFALYLGAAVAAPLVAPGGYAVVCSADGIARLVQVDDSGVPGDARHATLHCPLCVPASAPPPPAELRAAQPPLPLACELPAGTDEWPSAVAAAPPPARGPPVAV
jgi:hypothetical protein